MREKTVGRSVSLNIRITMVAFLAFILVSLVIGAYVFGGERKESNLGAWLNRIELGVGTIEANTVLPEQLDIFCYFGPYTSISTLERADKISSFEFDILSVIPRSFPLGEHENLVVYVSDNLAVVYFDVFDLDSEIKWHRSFASIELSDSEYAPLFGCASVQDVRIHITDLESFVIFATELTRE